MVKFINYRSVYYVENSILDPARHHHNQNDLIIPNSDPVLLEEEYEGPPLIGASAVAAASTTTTTSNNNLPNNLVSIPSKVVKFVKCTKRILMDSTILYFYAIQIKKSMQFYGVLNAVRFQPGTV